MVLKPYSAPVPIEIDTQGTARVSGTRVTLDTIIYVFKNGATAEEIAQQYPAVSLTDIYAVITYYLQSTTEVEAYLQERQQAAERIRQENEARFDPVGIRARLLARRPVD